MEFWMSSEMGGEPPGWSFNRSIDDLPILLLNLKMYHVDQLEEENQMVESAKFFGVSWPGKIIDAWATRAVITRNPLALVRGDAWGHMEGGKNIEKSRK